MGLNITCCLRVVFRTIHQPGPSLSISSKVSKEAENSQFLTLECKTETILFKKESHKQVCLFPRIFCLFVCFGLEWVSS